MTFELDPANPFETGDLRSCRARQRTQLAHVPKPTIAHFLSAGIPEGPVLPEVEALFRRLADELLTEEIAAELDHSGSEASRQQALTLTGKAFSDKGHGVDWTYQEIGDRVRGLAEGPVAHSDAAAFKLSLYTWLAAVVLAESVTGDGFLQGITASAQV